VGLKLNGTHQLLAYADDVNLLGDNIDTVEENKETLIDVGSAGGHFPCPANLSGLISLVAQLFLEI
jgi:hypothetical protein